MFTCTFSSNYALIELDKTDLLFKIFPIYVYTAQSSNMGNTVGTSHDQANTKGLHNSFSNSLHFISVIQEIDEDEGYDSIASKNNSEADQSGMK